MVPGVTVTVTTRVDDVINVKGHRIGTAELESCLVYACFVVTYMYMYMIV